MAYFLALWKNETWKRKTICALEGYPELDYAAAEGFKEANISQGDVIFIVINLKGSLYLGGKITVEAVVSQEEVARRLSRSVDDLWKSEGYVLARKESIEKFIPDCEVPIATTKALKVVRNKGFTYLKFSSSGALDRQTLRQVRLLYEGSEQPLLRLLRAYNELDSHA